MESNRTPRMNIVLIGAGNVATHLGSALRKAGHRVVQVYSRTEESAALLAILLGTTYTTRTEDIVRDADLYIASLKDDALQQLVPALTAGKQQALFVHTAGSLPLDVWKGHAVHYGVLYPMQTFSKQRAVDLAQVPFFIEASTKEDLEVLRQLAYRLSPHVHEATSAQRSSLHLAAVFACNFANHMYALSARLLEARGIPFDVMLPLIDETARKVHELAPREAQTGPAVRYDTNIIGHHLDMLAGDPALRTLYENISKSIHQLKEEE